MLAERKDEQHQMQPKRDLTNRPGLHNRPAKQLRKKFDVSQFIRTLFGNARFTVDHEIESLVSKCKRVASMVSACAYRHDIHDTDFVSGLIIRLVSDEATDNVSLDELRNRFSAKMKDNVMQYKMMADYILEYFAHHPADELLLTIFDARTYHHADLVAKLVATFTTLVEYNKNVLSDADQFDTALYPDFMAIKYLLMREDLMHAHLDELEHRLQDYACLNGNILLKQRNDGLLAFPAKTRNSYTRHKILSTVLYAWARENGFSTKAKLLTGLSRSKFYSLLSEHSFLKDCSVEVGESHGVWSHAIQWYCIIEHYRKHPEFLRHQPLDLYQQVSHLWNHIFDQMDGSDFSSPEYITTLLISPEARQRWPLLAGSVARAYAKMSSPDLDYQAHLIEKHGEANYLNAHILQPL